ncbi:hypothetical protein T06_1652 [Trichinella sp. T6]|nr:hypothetical protein T06_1652 [Trichinella sp. T6]
MIVNNFIPSWKWNNQSGNNEVGGSVKRLLTKREHTRKAERPAGQSGRPIVLERACPGILFSASGHFGHKSLI